MISVLIFAAALDLHSWMWQEGIEPTTNKTELAVIERRYRLYRRKKREEEETEIDKFHRFVRGGQVIIPKDLRAKSYDKVKPDPRDKKPRKYIPQKKENKK